MLRTHPGVAHAVVAPGAGRGRREPRRLRHSRTSAPDDAGLRTYLSARLPAVMVPARFRRLAELPLTSLRQGRRGGARGGAWPATRAPGSPTVPGVPLRAGGHLVRRARRARRLGRGTTSSPWAGTPSPPCAWSPHCAWSCAATSPSRTCSRPGPSAGSPRGSRPPPNCPMWTRRTCRPAPRRRCPPPSCRLWFLDQLAPDATAYNIALAQRLHGPLDVDALRRGADRGSRPGTTCCAGGCRTGRPRASAGSARPARPRAGRARCNLYL